jgi:hypothetical protein
VTADNAYKFSGARFCWCGCGTELDQSTNGPGKRGRPKRYVNEAHQKRWHRKSARLVFHTGFDANGRAVRCEGHTR